MDNLPVSALSMQFHPTKLLSPLKVVFFKIKIMVRLIQEDER